ncbi:MAG: porin family protein [Candidatus Krumholzibacteria bacterium]|nr:porin family protein [Candidatus Krumholzibacteria bacterium]
MRRIPLLTAVLILAATSVSAAEWHLGLQAGSNSSGLNGDSPSGVSLGKQSGLATGLVAEIRISDDVWLSAQPMYLQRGATSTIPVSGQVEKLEGPSLSLDYFAVPILAKITADNGRTYVVGGINPAFLLDAEITDGDVTTDASSAVNSFDLAADFGFGALFPVKSAMLNVELRYEQSILNLAATDREDGEDGFPARFRSTGFQFLAGLTWPLGGK